MSKYIKKDEDGFYVFDEREFLKTLPTGLEYFAVDKESEQIYGLGFNYKEKMEKQIDDLEAKLAESEKELNRYAELFGMKDKDFYVVEKTEYEKMKQGAKDIVMQLKQQLADLEAKLAESEKQIKDAREAGNMAVDSWCKNRRKYEAQIAEMQNKSFILYSMLYETLEKQGCDNVASQIDQMTGWTYDKEADWLKGNRNYDQLKQQLAEKEKRCEICGSKMILGELGYYCSNTELHNIYPAPNEAKPDYEEITLLKQDYDAMVEREELLRQQLSEKEKEIEYQENMKILAVENQNKKAIEQLEKVKEHNDNLVCDDEDYYNYITAFIDNQIKAIKEEK